MRAGPFKLQILGDQTWLYNLDNDPTERIDLAAAMPTLYLRAYSTHYKGFAPDLPRYAEWYGKEHPGMPAEEFLRLDDIAFDLEDFRQRFGPPGAAADP